MSLEDLQNTYHMKWIEFKKSSAVFEVGDIGIVTALVDTGTHTGEPYVIAIAKNGEIMTTNWVSFMWSSFEKLEEFINEHLTVVATEEYSENMLKLLESYKRAMGTMIRTRSN